jgi:predicted transcriptional regulator
MSDRLIKLTAEIVSSYVDANRVAPADVAALVQSTFAVLNSLGQSGVEQPEVAAKPTAAKIRRSITPDALISFIDGRPYRMLKRHLRTAGLTPEEYRRRFGLPTDYPLTAPSYSALRSALAVSRGLGRSPADTRNVPTQVAEDSTTTQSARTKKVSSEKAGPGARVPKALRSTRSVKAAPGDAS